MDDHSFAYAACPHCSGPVNISRAARGAALDVLRAVSFALTDSAVLDPRSALDGVIVALARIEGPEVAEPLWPVEKIARQAAIAAQKGRSP